MTGIDTVFQGTLGTTQGDSKRVCLDSNLPPVREGEGFCFTTTGTMKEKYVGSLDEPMALDGKNPRREKGGSFLPNIVLYWLHSARHNFFHLEVEFLQLEKPHQS